MQQTQTNKWDRLGVELKEFMKSKMDSNGELESPVRQLIKEFSDKHQETTFGSSLYYYYNDIKPQIEEEIDTEHEMQSETVIVEQTSIDDVYIPEDSTNILDELKSLVGYIKSKTDYNISIKSEIVIKKMIREHGAIKTLVTIFEMIDNIDNIDMFNVIVNEASKKINPSH